MYVVYYSYCGAYHTEVFTEEEFDSVFEGCASHCNESWILV